MSGATASLLPPGTGAIFNTRTCCWLVAIEIAGMVGHFPLKTGIALTVGALYSYLISPKGNPLLLSAASRWCFAATIYDSVAYRIWRALKLR